MRQRITTTGRKWHARRVFPFHAYQQNVARAHIPRPTTIKRVCVACMFWSIFVSTHVNAASNLRAYVESQLLETRSNLAELSVELEKLSRVLPDDNFVALVASVQSFVDEDLIEVIDTLDSRLLASDDEALTDDRDQWLAAIKALELLAKGMEHEYEFLSLSATALLLEPEEDDAASSAIANLLDTIALSRARR